VRLVFAGTPAVAVPTLEALVEAGHEIAAVVTRPDAPIGRKRVLTPSPVATAAERLGLDVIRAARLDDEATAHISARTAGSCVSRSCRLPSTGGSTSTSPCFRPGAEPLPSSAP
jgi:methionyl-tRNA formyltransferase